MDAAIALQPGADRRVWLHTARWDSLWLVASVVIVPLVLLLVWGGLSNDALNLGVTVLVGGPHLFSTYLATYFDPRFRRSHRVLLAAAAVLVPAFVILMTFVDFQVLLSLFIFSASAHVLQQNAYIADLYRARAGIPEPPSSRWIDYGFVGLSFYPIAAYKLVHGTFVLGDTRILIPSFLMTPWTYHAVSAAFAVFAVLWLAKTLAEARTGRLNVPKTSLLAFTAAAAFLVPMAASGSRLELAFQSINAWHSFQYLGLVWLIQKIRKESGELDAPWVSRLCGGGTACWGFYGACLAITLGLLASVFGVSRWNPFGLGFTQYYYMGVLSCLLIHYVLDAYLFTAVIARPRRRDPVPFSALAA